MLLVDSLEGLCNTRLSGGLIAHAWFHVNIKSPLEWDTRIRRFVWAVPEWYLRCDGAYYPADSELECCCREAVKLVKSNASLNRICKTIIVSQLQFFSVFDIAAHRCMWFNPARLTTECSPEDSLMTICHTLIKSWMTSILCRMLLMLTVSNHIEGKGYKKL